MKQAPLLYEDNASQSAGDQLAAEINALREDILKVHLKRNKQPIDPFEIALMYERLFKIRFSETVDLDFMIDTYGAFSGARVPIISAFQRDNDDPRKEYEFFQILNSIGTIVADFAFQRSIDPSLRRAMLRIGNDKNRTPAEEELIANLFAEARVNDDEFEELPTPVRIEGVTNERSDPMSEESKLNNAELAPIFEGELDREAMAAALEAAMTDQGLSVRKAGEVSGTSAGIISSIKDQRASLDKAVEVLDQLGFETGFYVRPKDAS